MGIIKNTKLKFWFQKFLKFQKRKDDNKSIGGLSNKEVSSWFILQGWYCHQLVW